MVGYLKELGISVRRRRVLGAPVRMCSNGQLRRIAHRAGIKTCGSGVYPILNAYIERTLGNIVRKTAAVTSYRRRSTVSSADVAYVLSVSRRHVYI